MFQYISCYSLSSSSFLFQIFYSSFNTSHVTLYRSPNSIRKLSIYCFNTSHVTLYPHSCTSVIPSRTGFNTSHVTLYQGTAEVICSEIPVSIHLMLLFIPRFTRFLSLYIFYNTAKYKEFQYFYQALLENFYFISNCANPLYFQYFHPFFLKCTW